MAKTNSSPINDPNNIPPKPIKGPAVNFNKRVRPDIEGITIPASGNPSPSNFVAKPELTNEEKLLIEDSPALPKKIVSAGEFKPISPRITLPARKSPVLKWLLICIFMAIIGAAGYLAYEKYYVGPAAEQGVAVDEGQVLPTTTPTPLATIQASSTPTTAPTPTPTTAASTNQIKINSTPTGYLNVRKTPSSSGALVTKVNPGENYPYTTAQNGWYQITLPDGSSGWVSGQYVTVQK